MVRLRSYRAYAKLTLRTMNVPHSARDVCFGFSYRTSHLKIRGIHRGAWRRGGFPVGQGATGLVESTNRASLREIDELRAKLLDVLGRQTICVDRSPDRDVIVELFTDHADGAAPVILAARMNRDA
jgi:hypothetical protein